ncbi:hypothetical protein MCEMSEM23_02442 [Rhabdaerophilaceae bacterium]
MGPGCRIFPVLIVAALWLGVWLTGGSAQAQQAGAMLFGARDFEMDWVQAGNGQLLRLRYLSARRILRIEALDGSEQVMLRDLEKGDVLILVAEGKRGVFGHRVQPMRGLSFVPGEVVRSIAGEDCRETTLSGLTLCLSDDLIPLVVNDRGQEFIAQRLLRQAQNPALFTVPKDTKIQPLPGNSGPLPGIPF